ncbi:DM13 domain-containing protein [Egbenema bharatensis]|uniref:DM13 domain-containing protein n=1 Tax=Egbenema bharatensis TaxID=3463334 RepID=UPI003A84FFCF
MNVKLCLVGIVSLVVMGCAGQIAADPAEGEPIQETISLQESDPVQVAESPVAASEPIQVAAEVVTSGEFESGEHPTQGTVQIIQQEGRTIVELGDSFQTSRGPDLFVILHRSPDVIGSTTPPDYPIAEGDYVILAPLAAPAGTQSYEIPADINLEDYASVAIWCRQFNATFGAAMLR